MNETDQTEFSLDFQGDIDVLFEKFPSEIGHPFSPDIVIQKMLCAKMPTFLQLKYH